ncbi:putative ATP-dependent RNA helicase DDX43 isoform X1 [Rhynchophorus ferrugineus]|uniref:putative ATP-dependent RNA helicase DDX43 isoform X1 n=1 Tax=Rhynchophorus ferrugineus TaxID=354439 RepID=UPI003FCCE790
MTLMKICLQQMLENKRGMDNNPCYNSSRKNTSDSVTELWIENRFIGKIIGKGGVNIRALERETGASVQVTNQLNGNKTLISVIGSTKASNKAIKILVAKTKHSPAPLVPELPPAPVPVIIEPLKKSPPKKDYFDSDECLREEEVYWSQFPEIKKNFYEEHPQVSALTEKSVAQIRFMKSNIVVDRIMGKNDVVKPIAKPLLTFEQAFYNCPEILVKLNKAKFHEPTPIQCQAWPILLSGEDMIGIAQTGSGKTLAFLLPAFIHIEGQMTPNEERRGPAVLIVAPTREMVIQINKEVNKYQYSAITSCCVYGGVDRKKQVAALQENVDIVIATPGKMNDLMNSGDLFIENITYVVLDEADRMLDMGFEAQIRRVLYGIRPTRQTVMMSATWPSGVRRLAASYTKDPVQVYVGSRDLTATHSVKQTCVVCKESEKENLLFDLLDKLSINDKVIVFCGTKGKAVYISVECVMRRLPSASIYGGMEQEDREQAINDITDGTASILIATDVVSSLDIGDVTHVINYDFPKYMDEYVHRIGRTGRAGKTGECESISFFTKDDWANASKLIEILEEASQEVSKNLCELAELYDKLYRKKNEDEVLPKRKPLTFAEFWS